MVFSSPLFLFLFLPIVICIYYLCGKSYRNLILLISSLLFYAWGEHHLVLLMIFSIVWNYLIGLLINSSQFNYENQVKWVLGIGISGNLVMLGYYKYFNFFIENIRSIGLLEGFTNDSIILPIGISFFTFQSISYLIDVYRKETDVQKNPLHLGLYISLFPQLIAGPIIRYHDVAKQIVNRNINVSKFYEGVLRFIRGLAKKMIIANNMALVADATFGIPSLEIPFLIAWLGVICYALQIYFDFSGYSDMAIGLGKMFGFDFLENFNYPYISKSIQEFWRRWHISLSSWFRDYLYIPLGGNRLGGLRTYVNLIIVFFLTGIWHGASWSFVVWGLFHGLFIIIERVGFAKVLVKLPVIFQRLYLIIAVLIGWVFFRAPDLDYALTYIASMFGFTSGTSYLPLLYLNPYTFTILVIGLFFSTPIRINYFNKLLLKSTGSSSQPILETVGYILLLLYCISELAQNSYNPFIYFRF